jgi:hypothetical protein
MDNPAGRLRFWVERFVSYTNKGEAIVVAACSMLDEDANQPSGRVAVMRLGAQLADMCDEVRAEVALLPDYLHPEMLLSDFHQVEAAVDQMTMARQVTVEAFTQQINPAGHRGLEYLDAYLHSHRAQPWIDDETRESLIEQVRSLIDGITEDLDLAVDVKQFVLRRLDEVETALREALLTGTPGIEFATDALIGAMRRRPDMWDRVAQTKWGPRLAKMAGALCLALGSAGGLPALMPGDEVQPPAIHNTVDVDTAVTVTVPAQEKENHGIHDAEILEDDEDGSSAAAR